MVVSLIIIIIIIIIITSVTIPYLTVVRNTVANQLELRVFVVNAGWSRCGVWSRFGHCCCCRCGV